MTQQRFVFEVPEADLQDLRARLGRTRWPIPWPATGWEAGTHAPELHRLVQVWGSHFDWRAQEAALNALPSHMASIDRTAVHFVKFDGEDPDALPIVLTHGWPSSFLELTDPAHHPGLWPVGLPGWAAGLDGGEVPVLERLRRCAVAALQRRLCAHPSLPVLVHQHDLHVVSALLRTRPGHAGAGGGGACADGPGGLP